MDTFVTKAARLNGPRDIELIERELVCGEDDIIVKNHLMGICGSDKNFYRGYLPPKTAEFRQDPKFPFLLGHESGGTVVAVGSRVADYKVGDKVMAFGWNNNFAEYFAAKSFQLQPVPYGLDMDIASLGEPISCAMYSGLNSGVQLGDTVVVMGGGFAGQIIAQCARRKGAYRVIVVDVLEGKLALARRLGADITLNPGQDDVIEAVKDLTNGLGADVVVEAAGTAGEAGTAHAELTNRVVLLAIFLLAQHVIGFGDVLELLLGFLGLVDVRMVFAGELAVRLLDVVVRSVLGDTKDFVEVFAEPFVFSHSCLLSRKVFM